MDETTLDAEAEVFSRIGGLSLDVLDGLRVHLKINIRFLPDGRKTKKVVLKLLMRYLMSNDVLDTEVRGTNNVTFSTNGDALGVGEESAQDVKKNPFSLIPSKRF